MRVINNLKEIISNKSLPVVFCHNDLLAGNIIWNEKQNKIRFIDFEYATYNYRGYDIANHFCEFAGFECNWNAVPSHEFQLQWSRWYLASYYGEIEEKLLQELMEEIQLFIPYSHLYWSLWALHQAANSSVDFDYLGYAAKRLGQIQHIF